MCQLCSSLHTSLFRLVATFLQCDKLAQHCLHTVQVCICEFIHRGVDDERRMISSMLTAFCNMISFKCLCIKWRVVILKNGLRWCIGVGAPKSAFRSDLHHWRPFALSFKLSCFHCRWVSKFIYSWLDKLGSVRFADSTVTSTLLQSGQLTINVYPSMPWAILSD